MYSCTEKDGVAILSIEHGKVNALDLELCKDLTLRVTELSQSSRALVLTGRGKALSAGVDLLRILDEGERYVDAFLPALSELCETLFSFPKPLVAAINGHAIAGGCVIACTADLRLMADGKGRVGIPELLVGVPFPAVALEIMRFALPSRFLNEIVFIGGTYTPEESLKRSLIDRIVEPGDLIDESIEAAKLLSQIPPDTFAVTKRQLRMHALNRMKTTSKVLSKEIISVWKSQSARDAIGAFVQKTFRRE